MHFGQKPGYLSSFYQKNKLGFDIDKFVRIFHSFFFIFKLKKYILLFQLRFSLKKKKVNIIYDISTNFFKGRCPTSAWELFRDHSNIIKLRVIFM